MGSTYGPGRGSWGGVLPTRRLVSVPNLFSLLFAVATLAGFTAGQSCVPFTGAPLTQHKCDPLVTWPSVLLLPGSTYEDIDEAASEQTKLFGVFVPPACRDAALRLVCLGNFVSCEFNPSGFHVYPPCMDVCEEAVAECSDFLIAAGQGALIPNCSAINPLTNGPLYPTSNCNNASADITVAYSQADCPYPTKYTTKWADAADPSTLCVIPCPSPMFTDDDYDSAYGILISFSGVSFAMAIFMCITWVLNPRKRSLPAFIPFWMAFCSMMNAFSILISIFVGGPKKVNCTWDDVPVVMEWSNAGDNNGQGVVCMMQSIILLFFAVTGSFWWLTLVISLFSTLVLGLKKRVVKIIYYISHFVNWGIGLVSIIIGFSSTSFGSTDANHNCWLADPYDWAAFYCWVLLNLVIGTLLACICLAKVIKVKAKFTQSHIKIEHIIRMGLLILMYWAVYIYFCIYRFVNEARKDDYTRAFEDQIKCSALTGTECPLEDRINRGMWFLQAMTLSSHGIIIFMVIAFTKETLYFWLTLLRNWRQPWQVINGYIASSVSTAQGSVSAAHSSSHKSSISMSDDGIM